jgi:hypothetical protein
LTISATASFVRKTGAGSDEYSSARSSPLRASSSDDREGRAPVILDGRPLAQELGVHADAEVLAGRLARAFLQTRDDERFDRSWKHRAPDADDVIVLRRGKGVADLFDRTAQMVQAQTAVRIARRAHADHRHVRAGIRFHVRAKVARLDDCRDELGQPRLPYRAQPAVDAIDLRLVDVDAAHIVTVRRETGCRNRTHIAQTVDVDLHRSMPH